MRTNDLIGLKLAVTRLIRAFPPGLRKRQEAIGMGRLKLSNRFIQPFSDSAREIHHHADVLSIHERKHGVDRRGILHLLTNANPVSTFGDAGKVRVNIN